MADATITLPPDLQQFLDAQVAAGVFASQQDAVQAAVQLLRERHDAREELRRELQIGIDQLDCGDAVPFDVDAIMKRVDSRLRNERGS